MKMDLAFEQARVHKALGGGFLKVDKSSGALWVSDLPRRSAELQAASKALDALGVRAVLDEETRLWHLDWTEEKWAGLLEGLSEECPSLPEDERLHEAYAFCRFALAHPCKRTEETLQMAREILKGTADFRRLHEKAAEIHRNGKPAAYDAGRLLAALLGNKEERQ